MEQLSEVEFIQKIKFEVNLRKGICPQCAADDLKKRPHYSHEGEVVKSNYICMTCGYHSYKRTDE